MRPFRSFLLLLIFLACFTGLYYIIPGNLHLPKISEFIPSNLIKELIRKDSVAISSDTLLHEMPKFKVADTLVQSLANSNKDENDLSILLAGFIDSVRSAKEQVRIMYYGDSQIEGDRITSYLRQSLRERSGGTGPGLFLPIMPVMYTKSLFIRSSSNWARYNYLSYKNGEIDHKRLGPFMTICRFLPPGKKTVIKERAFVRIVPSKFADNTTAIYDMLRIFYGENRDTVSLKIKVYGHYIFAGDLLQGKGVKEISYRINNAKDIVIEFEGRVSPDIYGISIESRKGVIVDNIPQRGSAGLEFTMVDKSNLGEIYGKLNPDLFILHYGLNIVRNIRSEYSYYENGLYRQLELLKQICPQTPILVVSITDMAMNDGDSLKSYPNISSIRDAQKKAASDAGAGFWDSYSAMGGKSSIIKWAGKKPPLVQKDYVHFTYPGADSLSQLLITALFTSQINNSLHQKEILLTKDSTTLLNTSGNIESIKKRGGKGRGEILFKDIFNYDPDKPLIFTTSAFWLFLLIVLAGYSLIYKKLFLRNFYLFLISLFFYFKTGGLFLFLLLFVIIIDFTCGLLIYHSKTKIFRKFYILISIISNLSLLAYFKYAGFFISAINDFLGTDLKVYNVLSAFSNSLLGTSFDISNIILPVGISFFTFQSLSYTLDVFRRKIEPVSNILDFGFYVSFFPHLVAGPIVRASVFIPQLYQKFRLTPREFSHALFMILKGLIKKIIISNFIAVNFIDRVFDAPSMYSGFENLMAVYGYGLQIYCDFSGYTDIAIGVALILGFRLPINFNSPYKADSIADFWKRWHISLSQWLKDYLYIPLGGNRKGKIRTYFNLMVTMLLGGLWHGAALRFVIWGALHGIGLVINRIWGLIIGSRLKTGRINKAISVFITFQFVSFCWIFFRAGNMESVIIMLKQITQNFSPSSFLTVIPAYGNVFLLIVLGYLIHFLPEKTKESYRGVFIRFPLAAQLATGLLIAILIYQMKTAEILPFIYFRF